jgi:hypothetical protein
MLFAPSNGLTMRNRTIAAAALSGLIMLAQPALALELVMFDEDGCVWCARWTEEIGPIYPKSEEGRIAPLRRVDLHEPRPDDLVDIRPVAFTPTFVLIDGGQEIGRIEGYPGEDFFWGLLDVIFQKIPTDPENSTASIIVEENS